MSNLIPKISVVLSTYNDVLYIAEAIESILKQTFTDFEFIIINDGSTDGTDKILDKYAQKDARIKVCHQKNAGLIYSLNKGIKLAKAPLIARMDGDDIALPQRFDRQFNFLQKNREVAVVGGQLTLIDKKGVLQKNNINQYPLIFNKLKTVNSLNKINCILAHPTVIMRRSILLKVGGYRSAYAHAEDYDLWLRIMEQAYISNLPDILVQYRVYDNSVSIMYAYQQYFSMYIARLMSKRRCLGQSDPTSILSAPLKYDDLDNVCHILKLTAQQRIDILIGLLQCSVSRQGVKRPNWSIFAKKYITELSHYAKNMDRQHKKNYKKALIKLIKRLIEHKLWKDIFLCIKLFF